MTKRVSLWWLLVAVGLAVASACGLVFIRSGQVIPSALGNPVADFVSPGVSVWWLVLGGPFQSGPQSPGGVAFASVSDAFLWLLVLWAIAIVAGGIRRILRILRS